MESLAPVVAALVMVAVVCATWSWYRSMSGGRRFRRAERFREQIRPPQAVLGLGRPREPGLSERSELGLDLSLQEQSRPFRTGLWYCIMYPPGAWKEIRQPSDQWEVLVDG